MIGSDIHGSHELLHCRLSRLADPLAFEDFQGGQGNEPDFQTLGRENQCSTAQSVALELQQLTQPRVELLHILLFQFPNHSLHPTFIYDL